MACTPGGYCVVFLVVLFVLFIAVGFGIETLAKPNGELAIFFSVSSCFSSAQSVSIAGRGIYDAYVMRPITSYQPGAVCPTVLQTSSKPLNISLESDDGWRKSASYKPIFLLPAGSYARMTIGIKDQSGNVVLAPEQISTGPDVAFPWASPLSTAAPDPLQIDRNISWCAADHPPLQPR